MTGEAENKLEQRVLILAPTGRDGPLTEELLRRSGYTPEVCPDMECLCRELLRGVGPWWWRKRRWRRRTWHN